MAENNLIEQFLDTHFKNIVYRKVFTKNEEGKVYVIVAIDTEVYCDDKKMTGVYADVGKIGRESNIHINLMPADKDDDLLKEELINNKYTIGYEK